jgi:hypothetical protein
VPCVLGLEKLNEIQITKADDYHENPPKNKIKYLWHGAGMDHSGSASTGSWATQSGGPFFPRQDARSDFVTAGTNTIHYTLLPVSSTWYIG